ncbi:MAG: biopolymer transporter ExbD [Sphaerochaeta sp.]|nr:biopolymer transporter ExbD [Sphaerochaeta sp.]
MRKKRSPAPTAMTDIAFLLLLFFLILAISTHVLPIPLTPAQSDSSATTDEPPHLLLVSPNGDLYYQGNPTSLDQLPETEEFSLLADKDTPFKKIAPIIKALQEKGITTLHCVVEQSQ